ncbi:hypothetical protein D3OALGB2SA_1999 [Olavius algarvensis associated proteobacterium Delta 3]|nr:hypothetical protein D3OALGB2SA_1999 [Olavius algarvensis associated proteobacterium Delta 3]
MPTSIDIGFYGWPGPGHHQAPCKSYNRSIGLSKRGLPMYELIWRKHIPGPTLPGEDRDSTEQVRRSWI